MDKIIIKELTFSAAHYIPEHAKCSAIHGHTFFVRNVVISCSKLVDFADVMKIIAQWDHTFIVPEKDYKTWLEVVGSTKDTNGTSWRFDLMTVQGDPTCEKISETIQNQIHAIPGVVHVSLELYEGPNQGALRE